MRRNILKKLACLFLGHKRLPPPRKIIERYGKWQTIVVTLNDIWMQYEPCERCGEIYLFDRGITPSKPEDKEQLPRIDWVNDPDWWKRGPCE